MVLDYEWEHPISLGCGVIYFCQDWLFGAYAAALGLARCEAHRPRGISRDRTAPDQSSEKTRGADSGYSLPPQCGNHGGGRSEPRRIARHGNMDV